LDSFETFKFVEKKSAKKFGLEKELLGCKKFEGKK